MIFIPPTQFSGGLKVKTTHHIIQGDQDEGGI